uniref:Glutaredoxin domain-containing protein n=1 Tax=Cryptomonas curvata TaxID=233186 RepID=A0A7S0LUA8_9CRYP
MALACCYCSATLSTSLPARQRSSQSRPKLLGLKGGECSGKTLSEIVSMAEVVLVRNGEDDAFSNRLIDILEAKKVQFKTIDVSADKHLAQMFEEGTREVQPSFSFPQIFAKGKIVVGLDMIKDLLESGDDIDEKLAMQQLAGSLASAWHSGAKGAGDSKPSSTHIEPLPS